MTRDLVMGQTQATNKCPPLRFSFLNNVPRAITRRSGLLYHLCTFGTLFNEVGRRGQWNTFNVSHGTVKISYFCLKIRQSHAHRCLKVQVHKPVFEIVALIANDQTVV